MAVRRKCRPSSDPCPDLDQAAMARQSFFKQLRILLTIVIWTNRSQCRSRVHFARGRKLQKRLLQLLQAGDRQTLFFATAVG